MKSGPEIEELENQAAWEKILTLPYGEIAPFVIRHVTRPSIPMMFVWLTAASSLFLSVWLWPGIIYPRGEHGIIEGLLTGLLLLPFLLIPVHEGAHLIPFSLAGARDIRFGADLKQGIIYVTAHRFVAGKWLFAIVAMTPFLVVTISLGVLIFLTPPWWKWVISMTLFAHTTMCAGDAALLGFMHSFGKKKVCTWDDADKKEAYFYASKQL